MIRTPAYIGSRTIFATFLFAAAFSVAGAQAGQTVADRVHDAPDGTVRFTFRARPDVCGSGNSVYSVNSNNHSRNNFVNGNGSADVEWDDDCGHGPVRIVLDVHDHAVSALRFYVGGRWRPASGVTDLGDVTPQAGANYLVSLARQAPVSIAKKAIFPATLADSVVIWPSLMQIARNDAIARDVRRDAVFWLGQMAGEAVTANLAQLVAEDTVDREVRKSAVFALSQQRNGDGVPALIHVAQTNRDPAVRKNALFWLGQSNDPRALALFENILAGSGNSRSR